MQLSVQGVGRLGQDVRLTETIIGGKPMRVVYNSLAIFQNASEPFLDRHKNNAAVLFEIS